MVGRMVIDSFFVALSAGTSESVTLTWNLKMPGAVGRPAMTPFDESSDSPAGSNPDASDQVYGATPPSAPRTAL
jgi:hypothetical protein